MIVNGRYVLDDPNNEGAYIDLGTFGEADAAAGNEFVMDDQVTLSKTGEFGNNHDIRDGYSFTIEGNQDLTISMEGLKRGHWEILDTDTQKTSHNIKNGQQTINLGPGKYYLDVGGSNIGSLYTLSLTTDSAQPVINNIYSNPDKRYVDVIDPQSMFFNTGSIAGSILLILLKKLL